MPPFLGFRLGTWLRSEHRRQHDRFMSFRACSDCRIHAHGPSDREAGPASLLKWIGNQNVGSRKSAIVVGTFLFGTTSRRTRCIPCALNFRTRAAP